MNRSLLKSVLTLVFISVLITPALGESRLQSILANGELRVGTTGDWNPMTMIDPNSKERTGFDIDIANALASDMGVKVVFVPTTWKTLVNGVVADKYDMTSSASLSPKRALVAGYSGSYFAVEDVPIMLKKNKGKYNSWEDLNNPSVTVAVTLGTVQEKRAAVLFDNSEIIKVSSPARDYQEVLAGRADISMTSNLEAAKLVEQYPELMIVPVQKGKNPTPLAMLLPQADQVWINYVNHWIILKTERGFFDQLKAKWLKQ
jgi:cyclohexadienyl dehydratase